MVAIFKELYWIFAEITKYAVLIVLIFFALLPLIDSEIEDFFSRKYLPAATLLTLITFVLWIFFGR